MKEDEQVITRPFLTWIEWFVIAFALFIFIGLLLPSVGSRPSARRTSCLNNIRQIGVAIQSYNSAHQRLPSGAATNGESFFIKMSPYLDNRAIADDFRSGLLTIKSASEIELRIFHCPVAADAGANWPAGVSNEAFTSHYVLSTGPVSLSSDGRYGQRTHTDESPAYVFDSGESGLIGLRGMFSPRVLETNEDNIVTAVQYKTKSGLKVAEITDGLSNTIAGMESSRDDQKTSSYSFNNLRPGWAYGQAISDNGEMKTAYFGRSIVSLINSNDRVLGKVNPIHEICASSNHAGGAVFTRGDGSTLFVSEDTDLLVLQAAAGINDGERFGEFE